MSACDNPAKENRTLGHYIAHVRQNDDGTFAIHNLDDHLRTVANLAGKFASVFGHEDWGRLAGIWHDLGYRCLGQVGSLQPEG